MIIVTALMLVTPARADWLDRAWSEDAMRQAGAPAITMGVAGIVLVLPEATLQEAHAAGRSTPEVVERIVERYGPRCSEVLDLDRPHQHLRVQLFLQKPVALEDAPEGVQGEVLEALKAKSQKPLPHIDRLFATTEDYSELFIDYVPEHKAHCIAPGAEIS